MKGVAISFREVTKSFDQKLVLDRVSLDVSPGEVLVLLGRSGCGKTTLLRLVNRLVDADAGEVYVGGREVADWDPVELRRGIGYAIQGVGLLPHLSVGENVSLVPRLLGWNPERRPRRRAGARPDRGRRVSFLEFLAGRWSEILSLTLEHVVLVVISTVAGVLIAVPLGLAITRIPALGRPVLGFAGVIQTVPSLALFGLLIPLPLIGGIGSRTAIIALVLYALLPILRNTVTGVRQVDPAILDAANGMGMTDWQRLTLVEVPLALPSIFSGIRIATVVGVGLVTIAAAVGAGGLGSLIFRGLAMLDSRLLFAGAIPSAILALLADGGLAMLEARLVASRGASTS